MGRPQKQTADWFPHYVADGRTKFILEDGWGNDGYAFWFKLLELLCRSNGHCYDCAENGNMRYLTAFTKVNEEMAGEIITTLVEMGKIDRELWEKKRIIWCQTLVDNLANMYSKRTVSAPVKPGTEEYPGRKPDDTHETGEESPHEALHNSPEQEKPTEAAPPTTGEPEPPQKKPRRRKPSSLTKKQEELFNRFWQAYPHKVAIGEAEKAWAKIDPDSALADKIIEAVLTAIKLDSRFREVRYTPHPATWLNGREWLNEYDDTQKGGTDNGNATDRRDNSGFRASSGFRTPGENE